MPGSIPELTIYVIRHGETDYNRDGRLQGSLDIPLNEVGRRQASANGKALAALPGFSAKTPEAYDWVASPLIRARQTMELARTAMGLDPARYRTDPLLIELSYGDWEGFTLAQVDAATPGIVETRAEDKWQFLPPGKGAESYEMMACRIDKFLASVKRPTVCVAHGGTIRALFNRIGGVSDENAAVLEIPQDRILKIEGGKIGWI